MMKVCLFASSNDSSLTSVEQRLIKMPVYEIATFCLLLNSTISKGPGGLPYISMFQWRKRLLVQPKQMCAIMKSMRGVSDNAND